MSRVMLTVRPRPGPEHGRRCELPVGVGLPYTLPTDPILAGLEVAIQAGVQPGAAPGPKQVTTVYRPRFTF